MEPQNRKKQNQFIIDKSFQFSFLKYFAVLSFLQIAAQLILIVLFQNRYREMIKNIGIDEGDIINVFFEKQTGFLMWSTLSASLLFLVIMLIIGLKLSHKVAGPIKRAINFLNNDEYHSKDLTFRQNDYFINLADSINNFIKNNVKKNNSLP